MVENPTAMPPTAPDHSGFAASVVAAAVPRPSLLGVIALIIALVAAVGAAALSAITGFAAAYGAMSRAISVSPEGLENLSNDQLLALLSPFRGLVLWAEIGLGAGTLLGIWAVAQGIVAIASRRGRGPAIAAVVVASIGPVVFAATVGAAVLSGIAAGANAVG